MIALIIFIDPALSNAIDKSIKLVMSIRKQNLYEEKSRLRKEHEFKLK